MSSTSEAATSTDDLHLQGPLCLFYFECPFAILSATPPRYVVMPHYWREQPPYYDTRHHDDGPYNNHTGYPGNDTYHHTNGSYHHETGYHNNESFPNESYQQRGNSFYNGYHNTYQKSYDDDSKSIKTTLKPTDQFPNTGMPFNPEKEFDFNTYTKLSFDLGQAKVHRKPLTLSPFPKTPCFKYPNASWLDSSTPSFVVKKKRKSKKRLPPLELPSPKEYEDLSTDPSTDWLSDFKTKTKISLPPISMVDNSLKDKPVVGLRERQDIRLARVGVRKKRSQLSGVRRTMVALMQRKLKGGVTLSRVLRLVRRPAWSDPRLIKSSSSSLVRSSVCDRVSDVLPFKSEQDGASVRHLAAMLDVSVGTASRRRTDVSRGLLHRRYSMPETVMRKYHLAQSSSECSELSVQTCPSPPSGSGHHRLHDIQDMRKSALTRKWRLPTSSSPQPRSLDGSYSDLRPRSRKHSPAKSLRKHLCGHLTQSTCRSNDQLNSYTESSSEALQTETDTKSNGSSDVNESLIKSNINSLDGNKSSYSVNNDVCHASSNQTKEATAQESSYLLIVSSTTDDRVEIESPDNHENNSITTDTFSSSLTTTKELITVGQTKKDTSNAENYDVRVDEFSNEYENYDNNIVPYYESVQEYPNYEMLEIVVSESINRAFGDQVIPDGKCESPEKVGTQIIKNMRSNGKTLTNIDIDEYISNILVESLHSLTDQIESMNACMGNDRKVSIVEKEIKVKLQNTGMNTIVHLSPTSNNPIIFGNEELYHNDEDNNDSFNNNINIANVLLIREETASVESNNNSMITPETYPLKSAFSIDADQENANVNNSLHHETVNHAVLQQIQKLFQDEFRSLEPDCSLPVVSHIEISNVDVFVNENQPNLVTTDSIELDTQRNVNNTEYNMNKDLLSTVGAGNYYNTSEPFIVPRYNAIPHTTSMEVNTSSSESDQIVSECTSLVDSLDDPNSPRILLSKNCKEHNLVRSAIDVLSLLPDSERNDSEGSVREKGESFYIRIKDNQCDCEKENVVVADHMPEKIKEKLFNRHKRREMRIECARYKKAKQLKKELEKQQYHGYMKSKKHFDTDCISIVNMLVDEIVYKIAQDEYKYMRIKEKKNTTTRKAHDILKKSLRKSTESLNNIPLESNKIIKKVSSQFSKSEGNLKNYTDKPHIKGKLSLQANPPSRIDASPKRIYQKSEFHDGNNCIEILEILEYSDRSQSSPETNSDENQYHSLNKRKSKIPIPVNEKIKKSSKPKTPMYQKYSNYDLSNNKDSSHLTSLEPYNADFDSYNQSPPKISDSVLFRQSQKKSLTRDLDTRSVSNSVKFKRVFEIIPEEKYGGNSESSNIEVYSKRRPSAPTLPCFREINDSTSNMTISSSNTKNGKNYIKDITSLRKTGTSPVPFQGENKIRKDSNFHQKLDKGTELKHVSTSPIGRNLKVCSTARRPPSGSRDNVTEQVDRKDSKSAFTQYEDSTSGDKNNENNQTDDKEPTKSEPYVKPEPYVDANKKDIPVKIRNSTDMITKKRVRKLDEKRLAKKKVEMEYEKRRLSLSNEMRSLSDPQLNQVALRKKERHKYTEQVAERRDVSMSSSGESSSLLCCVARGRGGGKGRSQRAGGGLADCGEATSRGAPEVTQTDVTSSSAWSVTVGGAGGGGLLPQQLQMRLSFAPPPGSQQPMPSVLPPVAPPSSSHQSSKSALAAVALPPPLVLPPAENNQICRCRHCAECSCPQINQQRSLKDFLPVVSPASRRVIAQAPSQPRAPNYTGGCSESLCVRGAGVLPSRKPRAPNASERDVTRARARVRARHTETRLAALMHHHHWR